MTRPWEPRRIRPAENDGCAQYKCFMEKEHLRCQVAHLTKQLADMRGTAAKGPTNQQPAPARPAPTFGGRR